MPIPVAGVRTRWSLTIATVAYLLFCLAGPVEAVVPSWTTLIQGPQGGYPYGIVERGDVTFALIGGSSESGDGVCRVARLDASGTVTWIRQIATGPTLDCDGMAGDETGLYVGMSALGPLDGVPGDDGFDAYVRKLGFDASEIWTRSFSGPDSELTWAIAAGGGNVVMGGYRFFDFSTGISHEAFVRSYDVDGNVRWTRLIDSEDDDVVTAVAVDVSGTYASVLHLDAATTSIHGFSSDGRPRWTTPIDTGGGTVVNAMSVSDDHVYTAGDTDGVFPSKQSAGGTDVFVATFGPSSGASGWVRQFGTPGSESATALGLGPAGVYVAGRTDGSLPRFEALGHGDAFVRSYTTSGRRRWTRQFGTHRTDSAQGVTADADGVTTLGITAGNLGTGHVEYSAIFVRRWIPA